MTLLDVGEVEAFALVAETGSFSAAARRLFLSQPAVSRRVGRLEQVLGIKLLDRTSRCVQLTPAGMAVLSQAQALLDSHADLLAAVSAAACPETSARGDVTPLHDLDVPDVASLACSVVA